MGNFKTGHGKRCPVGKKSPAGRRSAHTARACHAAQGPQVEFPADQRRLVALAHAAEIGPDLHPLGRAQKHVGPDDGSRQQAAVGADHRQRAPVGPGQIVDAGVGAIQDAQAMGAGNDLLHVPRLPVDQDAVPQKTGHALHGMRQVDQTVVFVKGAILDDQGEVVFIARQGQGLLFVVRDDKQACQPTVYLRPGAFVRVGVIPVSTGPVVDLEFIHELPAGCDDITGMAIHIGWHVQAMPVNNALFREFVVKMNADLLAAAHPDGGPQVAATVFNEMPRIPFEQSPPVSPYRGRPSRQNRAFRHGGLEGQLDIRLEKPIGSGLGQWPHSTGLTRQQTNGAGPGQLQKFTTIQHPRITLLLRILTSRNPQWQQGGLPCVAFSTRCRYRPHQPLEADKGAPA